MRDVKQLSRKTNVNLTDQSEEQTHAEQRKQPHAPFMAHQSKSGYLDNKNPNQVTTSSAESKETRLPHEQIVQAQIKSSRVEVTEYCILRLEAT